MNKKIQLDGKTKQLAIISIALFVIMIILRSDKFLSPANMNSMLTQLVEPGLFAMCITLAYLSGGIDLSIVSTANLVGIVNGMILRTFLPEGANAAPWLLLCVVVAFAIAVVAGTINGLLIAGMGIPPILVTLGTQSLFMGVAMILTKGTAEGNFPQALLDIGNAQLAGIPVVTIIFFAIAAILYVIVHKTPFGMKIQLIGANMTAAKYTGINVKATLIKNYILTASLGAIAGMVIMARSNSAKADYGLTYVFQALLTCVLGGVSPLGGKGKVYNVVLSLIALQILSTGFNMLRFSPLIRDSLFGFLLVFTIVIDYFMDKYKLDKMNKLAVANAKSQ